jgi:membrane protein required for colicin V production
MTVLDYAFLATIVISIGLGWWRGFVYELISLIGWIAAYFVARLFVGDVTEYVPDLVTSSVARTSVAYSSLFMVTLIASAIVAWVMSKLVKVAGMGLMDGFMGSLFGLLRGMLLVLLLVLLAGFTNLPKKQFWREAWSSKPLQSVALFTKDFLPDNLAKKVNY